MKLCGCLLYHYSIPLNIYYQLFNSLSLYFLLLIQNNFYNYYLRYSIFMNEDVWLFFILLIIFLS